MSFQWPPNLPGPGARFALICSPAEESPPSLPVGVVKIRLTSLIVWFGLDVIKREQRAAGRERDCERESRRDPPPSFLFKSLLSLVLTGRGETACARSRRRSVEWFADGGWPSLCHLLVAAPSWERSITAKKHWAITALWDVLAHLPAISPPARFCFACMLSETHPCTRIPVLLRSCLRGAGWKT